MQVRNAKITDAKVINALITDYAEQDRMLFRSLADIYENLQTFFVVENDSRIIGCCSLEIIWSDLAEIKSIAVDKEHAGTGVGRLLVNYAIEKGREIGVQKIFALTLTPNFFEKLGFQIVSKDDLPMKVWSDCAKCSKQQNCDEVAVIKPL